MDQLDLFIFSASSPATPNAGIIAPEHAFFGSSRGLLGIGMKLFPVKVAVRVNNHSVRFAIGLRVSVAGKSRGPGDVAMTC